MLNSSLKDLNLSFKELKAIAKIRGIKGYENMFKDKLLSVLKVSKSENDFDKTRIEKIREGFKILQYNFSESELKQIRKILLK